MHHILYLSTQLIATPLLPLPPSVPPLPSLPLQADLIQVQVVARAGARKWVPYNKPKRETGSGLLPSGYVGMEQMGKILKARYFGKAADMPLTNVTE
jgi:hypothetical protein